MTRLHRLSLALLAASAASASAAPLPSALYNDLHWRLLGPHRAGWATMIEGVPTKPDRFYFGAAGGGVWRTDDSGRTWKSLFDKGGSSAIGAIALAPSNPDFIYVGGGQPEPRYDIQAGRGVYRSTDGGNSWSDLGLADTRYIGRIWVSPTDPKTVLVAALGHVFGPSSSRGVYRSTDGGKSWAHTLAPGEQTGAVDLAADPAHPHTIFAATWQIRQWPWQSYFTKTAGSGSAIHRSDDGGVHWRRLSGGGWPVGPLGRISVATARTAHGLRLYAVVDGGDDSGLWRSDDGGAHWRHVNKERAFAGYYFSRLTVDPRDPNVVYTNGQSMRRCDQGGARCVIVRGSPGGDDYHHIWINPLHPDHIAAGSDQGAAVSVDGGATWGDWYNQPTGQLYHLATDDRFPYWVYSGQQDNGTVAVASRSDYGATNFRDWHPVGGDERDYDIPDPADPSIVYGSGLGGHTTRWDARTGQIADISPWPVATYGERPTTVKHHFNWVTPLVTARAGSPALYLGGEVVFRSRDRGDHWDIISPDLTGKTAGAQRCDGDVAVADAKACGYGTIVTLAPSPSLPGTLWAGTDTGLVSVTRDDGAHWANVTPPGVREWAKISSIDLSAQNPATAYVAVDGQRLDDFTPSAFRTHDGGASWTPIAAGLPTGQIVSVVRADPVTPGLLYAGTETGVWVSFDDGGNWQSLQHNLPTAWARDLLVHGDDLLVATQGRALWALSDLSPLRQTGPAVAASAAFLYRPAVALRVRGNNNADTPLPPETPVGENPPEGAVIDYYLGAATAGPVTLDVRDASGAIVAHYSSAEVPAVPDVQRYFHAGWVVPPSALPATPGHHRWVWNLRRPRPPAVEYSYSIAAIWGRDTPILPAGAWAEPGNYSVTLTAGGQAQTVPLHVAPDPRVTGADYAASAQFSAALLDPMTKAWRGAGETGAVHDGLLDRAKVARDSALAANVKAFAATLAAPPAETHAGFAYSSGVLAGLETAAEKSDAAPTAAMRAVLDETAATVEADWLRWQQRASDLSALNQRLVIAGLAPVVVPPPSALHVTAPDAGEELP
ncbi:MAG: hypothetical protein ABIW16_04520 [Sphingomicrobium sp.]